jgi:uncharacterized protein with HEPN domain
MKLTRIAPLSSEKPVTRFRDILQNAAAIAAYTAGMDFVAFRDDLKTRDAVNYCLLRISEAAVKLGDLAPSLAPEQPWGNIRALGNYLRHEYDSIELEQIWGIVQERLPSLCSACEAAVKRLEA